MNKDNKILDPNIPRYENLKNNVNSLFKFQSFSQAVQIGGTAAVSATMGTLNTPNGYTLLGVLPLENGYSDQWQVTYAKYNASGMNIVQAYIKSYYSTTLTATLRCVAVFVKTDYYNQNLIS